MLFLHVFAFFLFCNHIALSQLSGTYEVGKGLKYKTLALAITDLNAKGVSGAVTFELAAGHTEVAPAGGYVITASGTAENPIVFRKSEGENPLFIASETHQKGSATDAIIKLIGADYITIDGFTLQERNLDNIAEQDTAFATNTLTEWGIALLTASLSNGAQHNTIQNCKIALNPNYRNTFGIYSNVRHAATNLTAPIEIATITGTNSANKIYANEITDVNRGIAFIGSNVANLQDVGNDIGGMEAATGNQFNNWGSSKMSATFVGNAAQSYGIYMANQKEDNVSYNQMISAATASTNELYGIFSFTSNTTKGTVWSEISYNTLTVSNSESALTQAIAVFSGDENRTINIHHNTILDCAAAGKFKGIASAGDIYVLSISVNNFVDCYAGSDFSGIENLANADILNINDNTLTGTFSDASNSDFIGIANGGIIYKVININKNMLGNEIGNFVTFKAEHRGNLMAILNRAGATTATLSIQYNEIMGIVYNITSLSKHTYLKNTAYTFSQQISHNFFHHLNINTKGEVIFIENDVMEGGACTVQIDDNAITTDFTKTASDASVTFYTTNTALAPAATISVSNNHISNINLLGESAFMGINILKSGAIKTVNGNTFSNITGKSGKLILIAIDNSGANSSVIDNTITNITWEGAINPLNIGAANASPFSSSGNKIRN